MQRNSMKLCRRAIRARDVVRVAESIGFTFDRQRGSHAAYYRDSDNRRIVIPMHGGKDSKPGTLRWHHQ